GEVLVRFGEPAGGVPLLEEGDVVAGAPVAVTPVDHADVHPRRTVFGHVEHEPAELARRRVVLAANGQAPGRLRGRFRRGYALDEHTQGARVCGAVVRGAAADNVVAEHAVDIRAVGLHLLR